MNTEGTTTPDTDDSIENNGPPTVKYLVPTMRRSVETKPCHRKTLTFWAATPEKIAAFEMALENSKPKANRQTLPPPADYNPGALCGLYDGEVDLPDAAPTSGEQSSTSYAHAVDLDQPFSGDARINGEIGEIGDDDILSAIDAIAPRSIPSALTPPPLPKELRGAQ